MKARRHHIEDPPAGGKSSDNVSAKKKVASRAKAPARDAGRPDPVLDQIVKQFVRARARIQGRESEIDFMFPAGGPSYMEAARALALFPLKRQKERLAKAWQAIGRGNLLIARAHLLYADMSDVDALRKSAALGRKFNVGRKPGTGGPIRKAIAALLRGNPTLKPRELWRTLKEDPPNGWAFCENSLGKYIDGPAGHNMSYARFSNVCKEEQGKAANP
jgi:hypothetical protein